jgi:hypothetical protein
MLTAFLYQQQASDRYRVAGELKTNALEIRRTREVTPSPGDVSEGYVRRKGRPGDVQISTKATTCCEEDVMVVDLKPAEVFWTRQRVVSSWASTKRGSFDSGSRQARRIEGYSVGEAPRGIVSLVRLSKATDNGGNATEFEYGRT